MLKYWTTAKPRTVIMAARQNADDTKNAADRQKSDFLLAFSSDHTRRWVDLGPRRNRR